MPLYLKAIVQKPILDHKLNTFPQQNFNCGGPPRYWHCLLGPFPSICAGLNFLYIVINSFFYWHSYYLLGIARLFLFTSNRKTKLNDRSHRDVWKFYSAMSTVNTACSTSFEEDAICNLFVPSILLFQMEIQKKPIPCTASSVNTYVLFYPLSSSESMEEKPSFL